MHNSCYFLIICGIISFGRCKLAAFKHNWRSTSTNIACNLVHLHPRLSGSIGRAAATRSSARTGADGEVIVRLHDVHHNSHHINRQPNITTSTHLHHSTKGKKSRLDRDLQHGRHKIATQAMREKKEHIPRPFWCMGRHHATGHQQASKSEELQTHSTD
jgi:hypothetical protein